MTMTMLATLRPVSHWLPYAVAVWLLLVGLWGVVTSRHLVHLIVCLTVIQSSTYVLLLAVGYRTGGAAPIFASSPPPTTPEAAAQVVDPIVQALALTDIVVGATVTALLLAMAVQINKHKRTLDPDELKPMQG